MESEFPFSERFDFVEIKLNKILEHLYTLSMQLVESKKPFLDIQEASKYLSVTKNTIYSWTSKNKIPHYKSGRKIYFSIDELNNWILNKDRKIRSMDEIESLAATKFVVDTPKGKK
jgi:excisionase family DNA binding protein